MSPSTSSGTTPSTGSGTAPRYNSLSVNHSGTARIDSVSQVEPESIVKQHTAADLADDAPKLQRGDVAMTDEMLLSDDAIMENKSIKDKESDGKTIIPQLNEKARRAKGGDVGDVATLIFGMLTLVSFALALIFFVSAFFAIDSLVLTVVLLIGGFFALAGLVLMCIWLILRKKSLANGLMSGERIVEDKGKPRSIWGLLIPAIVFLGITSVFFVLAASAVELSELIGLLFLAGLASTFFALFMVLAIIRAFQLSRYEQIKKADSPKDYKD